MSFFAIVKEPSSGEFEVAECHINLWCLSLFFSQRSFIYDVGLRLKSKDSTVEKIQLALPFGSFDKSRVDSLLDLHSLIFNLKTAQLLFGHVEAADAAASIIKYESSSAGQTELKVVKVILGQSDRNSEFNGEDHSFWTLQLHPGITPNSEAYLRIRFRVRNIKPTWTWKKNKIGALVDLRVADARGAVVNENWLTFQERIVPIKRLNLFVIAPSWLQSTTISPPCHYMRMFEGREWLPYLKRKVDFWSKEKLIIYQWRNKKEIPIDTSRPFHAFLDLNKQIKPVNFNNLLAIFLLTILSIITLRLLVVAYPEYLAPDILVNTIRGIQFPTGWIATGVILTLTLFIARYIIDYIISREKFSPFLGKVMDTFYRLLRWIYSVNERNH